MKTNRWSRRKPNGEMPEDTPPLPPEAENPTQPRDAEAMASPVEQYKDRRHDRLRCGPGDQGDGRMSGSQYSGHRKRGT